MPGRKEGMCLGSLTSRARYEVPPRRMNMVRMKTKEKEILSARNPPSRGLRAIKGALNVFADAI